MKNHHELVLQTALKSSSEWAEVLGRRVKARYDKHSTKIEKVQERASVILVEAAEMNLSETIKYFIERGERQQELLLLKKYYAFVVELKVRSVYDYQAVSKYSFELSKKLKELS